MNANDALFPRPDPASERLLTRRDLLKSAGILTAAVALAPRFAPAAEPPGPDARRASPKRYEMKKSINLWAFPYPQRMNLRECLQLAKDAGFDGIELNYDLESDLSPKSGDEGIREHPQDGGQDRHSNQRPVLVPVLAVSAQQQRSREARSRDRTRRQDRAGRARSRRAERARRPRRGSHPVAHGP